MIRIYLLPLLILATVAARAARAEPTAIDEVLSKRDAGTPMASSVAGVDAMPARELVKILEPEALARWGEASPFLRIRGLPDPAQPGKTVAVKEERLALQKLARWGFQPVAFLRWNPSSWAGAVRPGGGQRIPLDLREVFIRARAYAEAYAGQNLRPSEPLSSSHQSPALSSGSSVASNAIAFEFENEPDISFLEDNPETYAAFLKACWLGVHAGEEAAEGEKREAGVRDSRVGGDASPDLSGRTSLEPKPRRPRAVMAPLALPPGPYFEQLVRNGFLSYTDVFNYHFYGYADDFTGVYRQFEDAVAAASESGDQRSEIGTNASATAAIAAPEVGERRSEGKNPTRQDAQKRPASPALRTSSSELRKRELPVILTEYGYGQLDQDQRNTVTGRVRQWAWFREVGHQIEHLRIAGPMAFYLPPYLESGVAEMGLTMAAPGAQLSAVGSESSAGSAKLKAESFAPGASGSQLPVASSWTAGNLVFRPEDFGAAHAESWMQGIGLKIGENEATPALAWLLEEGRTHPYPPHDWAMTAPVPSPVVIDFIASPRLVQLKRYGGYLATDDPLNRQSVAAGELVLYNFSRQPIRGHLRALQPGLLTDRAALERSVELLPMARVLVPVRLTLSEERFERIDWEVRFVPDDDNVPASVFATRFFPSAERMEETVPSTRFAAPAAAGAGHRDLILRRARPAAEPPLTPSGRWLVTDGVTLTELGQGAWRFAVPASAGGASIATAELPLPDDFTLSPGDLVRLAYRLADPAGTDIASGRWLRVYFRTANGNLYGAWPWCRATADWQDYFEARENYTMMFYGRANLPWRFGENRIVSLVLTAARQQTPMTFEIHDARVVQMVRNAPTPGASAR